MADTVDVHQRLLDLRPDRHGPLADAVVLDFTINMAGPFCTLLLADLGAVVIKVEAAGGEPHRWISAGDGPMGPPWALVNRDKLSLALDLKDATEREEIFGPLVRAVDIVVHNFKPETATRLGIDEASIRDINPHAVHCAISGFGSDSQSAGLAGVDIVAEAFSGLASVTGIPGDGPVKIGVPLGDVAAGMLATIEVLGRWVQRGHGGGPGAPVDVALVDGATTFGTFNLALAGAGQTVGPVGREHQFMAPYGFFSTGQGGWIAMGLATDRHWEILCDAIGRIDLIDDPRFVTLDSRWSHRPELREAIEQALAARSALDWEEVLARERGLPVAAARSYDEVIQSAVLRGRGVIEPSVHPQLGDAVDLLPVSWARGRPHRPAQPLDADRSAIWKSLNADG